MCHCIVHQWFSPGCSFLAGSQPTGYLSILGSVSAVTKLFLEGGLTLSLPRGLSAALVTPQKTIWVSRCWSEESPPAVSRLCSGPGSSTAARALCWDQMGGNKDHSQRPHVFAWVDREAIGVDCTQKSHSNLSRTRVKPAPGQGGHKLLLDTFPLLFTAGP